MVQVLLSVVLVLTCVVKDMKEHFKTRFSNLIANDHANKLLQQAHLFLKKMCI